MVTAFKTPNFHFQKSISFLKAENHWTLFTTDASFPCLWAKTSVAKPLRLRWPSAASQTAAAVGSSITETQVALQLSISLPESALSTALSLLLVETQCKTSTDIAQTFNTVACTPFLLLQHKTSLDLVYLWQNCLSMDVFANNALLIIVYRQNPLLSMTMETHLFSLMETIHQFIVSFVLLFGMQACTSSCSDFYVSTLLILWYLSCLFHTHMHT